MGGAGEQTVVTGNPALLEGAKGSRITSLTLYGISSQGSTTGAQLFDAGKSELVYSEMGLTTTYNPETGWFHTKGMLNQSNMVTFWKEKNLVSIKRGEQYYFSVETIGENNLLALAEAGKANAFTNNNMSIIASRDVNVNQVYSNHRYEQGTVFDLKFRIIVLTGSTSKPYEPYTGGKPSPSPSYPQEIENAGDAGEININVQGANLFDINDSSTIMDNYYVNEKKEFSLAGGNYGRVFKLLPNTSYTWTQEQIIDGGQSYKTDIQLALFDEIPTQGKIAKEKYSNANLGEIVFKFNTDEKFVYLFVKTSHRTATKNRYKNEKMAILNVGTEPLPYEPYKPAQTLIIPTPNGLPGVPTIDNGNYTDASGQQWLCDEVDLKRGVYVQNVAFAEFGKGITSVTKNSGVSSKNIVSAYFFPIPRKRAKTRHTIMSNCLRFVANVSSGNPEYVISNESQTEAMYVSIPAELYENDDQMLNLLAEKKVKILYATYPTERPLSTEELEKYRSLRTYSPTTTVINDACAGMSVGYKRK